MTKILSIQEDRPTAETTVLLLPADPTDYELPELPTAIAKVLKPVEDEKIEVKSFKLVDEDALKTLITAQAGDAARSKNFAYQICQAVKSREGEELQVIVADEAKTHLPIILRELGLMDYTVDRLKEKPDETKELKLSLVVSDKSDLEELVDRQAKLSEALKFARRLVDEPANVITPETLAAEAKKMAEEVGLEYEVFDEEEIQAKGMEAFYSVAKGSDNPPRFIVLRHNGGGDGKRLVLVGKGLCYDSGGYAIKNAGGMVTMHADMAGAGAVLGTMKFLAETKAPVNVTMIIAAAENMISGHSYKNGDIVGSLSGKSIEVGNTDAEGRVTLADAITYAAQTEEADYIIDIATLTGAVVMALGQDTTGVMADDEALWESLERSAEKTEDRVWRFPVNSYFAEKVKSKRADVINSVAGGAGTITAGMFLREFALGTPWMHLDIAGTSYHTDENAEHPWGASGVGVELLAEIALDLL